MQKRGPGRPRKIEPIYLGGPVLQDFLVWKQTRTRKRCKKSTVKTVRMRLNHFVEFWSETFDLRTLTDVHVKSYMDSREHEEGGAPSTINQELITLNSLNLYITHVAKLWDKPPVCMADFYFDSERMAEPEITTVSEGEFHRLLRAAAAQPSSKGAPPERTVLVILIAFYTGLRHAEIAHLWHRDVDLSAGVLRVSRKVVGQNILWEPKTYEQRSVPMHSDLIATFNQYFDDSEEKPEDWVFPGYGTKCIGNFQLEVHEAFERAGLGDEKRRPGLHSLRRTWATNLLNAGNSLQKVMEIGGWKTLKSVQRYLTSTKESHREAINMLPSVLGTKPAALKLESAPVATTPTGGIDPFELQDQLMEKMGWSKEQAREFIRGMSKT